MSAMIENLERLLDDGQENALLRFSLGNAYLDVDASQAIVHLERAIELDDGYSAAWKLLGKAQAAAGATDSAIETYTKGIAVADEKGDVQASKEMAVFRKRLLKEKEQKDSR